MGWGCFTPYAGGPGTPPGSPIVTFNYPQFQAQCPAFAYVNETTAQTYFNVVGNSYIANNGRGVVGDAAQKLVLMNWLVAHLLQLFTPDANGSPPSTLVGRISSAGEGSVNVSTEYQPMTQAAAWYLQTPYGAAYWEAMKPFRSMRYRRGPVRNQQPWPFQ